MTDLVGEAMRKKGFIKICQVAGGAIGVQGTYLPDCWMWTGKITEYTDGSRQIQTVKVSTLKEAAYHYWIDEWVPIRAFTEKGLRALETELREHATIKQRGIQVPDVPFLERRIVPAELLKEQEQDFSGKTRVGEIALEELDALRTLKQAELA